MRHFVFAVLLFSAILCAQKSLGGEGFKSSVLLRVDENVARAQIIPMPYALHATLGQGGACTDTLALGIESANSLCDGTALLNDLWLNPSVVLPLGGTWTFPNGTMVPGGIVDVTTSPSGIYTYYYIDAEGCTTAISMQLSINSEGPIAFPANDINVCLLDPPFAPFDSLLGVPASLSGTWIYFGYTPPPAADDFLIFSGTGDATTWMLNPADYSAGDPMVDGYVIYYSNDPDCGFAQDTIFIDVGEVFDAGLFTSATICEGDSPVILETLLLGTPTIGGVWEDVNGDPVANIFDPVAEDIDSTYTLIYSGGFAGTSCFNSQVMQLTLQEITSDTISVQSCESFFWDLSGQTYTSSGFFAESPSVESCISIIVLDLLITEDSEAPSITCPMDIQVSVSNDNCTAVGFYALPSASDNCSTVDLNLDNGFLSGSDFPLGTNLITYSAADTNGNSATCSFNIEVVDFDPPEISCQDITIELEENGESVISINDIGGSSNDLCGIFLESLSQSVFTELDLGVNQVSYTSTDNNGNEATCISNVEVTSCSVVGGTIGTNDPRLNLCIGDGESNFIVVELSGNQGIGRFGIAESTTLNVVGGNGNGVFNMENYPPGSYFIGHVSYSDQNFFEGVNNVDDFEGCFDISNLIGVSSFLIDGGTISTENSLVVCVNSGISSSIGFDVEGNFGPDFVWAILDQGFSQVLKSNQTGIFGVEDLSPGIYKVVHAAYGGDVNIGQVDPQNIDGCVNSSNVLTMQIVDCVAALVEIAPNPARSNSTILFRVEQSTRVRLEIFDLQGSLMQHVYQGSADGAVDYNFEIDLDGLSQGVYICRLTTGEDIITKKIVVNR